MAVVAALGALKAKAETLHRQDHLLVALAGDCSQSADVHSYRDEPRNGADYSRRHRLSAVVAKLDVVSVEALKEYRANQLSGWLDHTDGVVVLRWKQIEGLEGPVCYSVVFAYE